MLNYLLFMVTVCMYTKGVLTGVPFHKSGHKRFNRSGPLLQIRSQLMLHNSKLIIYIQINMSCTCGTNT